MVRRTAWRGLPVVALVVAAAATGAGASTPSGPAVVELGGTPVTATSNAGDPTVLPAGLWFDTLDGPGGVAANVHRFRYERTMADSSVLVGVVGVSPETEGVDAVEVVVTPTGDDTQCGSASSSPGYELLGAPFGAEVVVTEVDRNSPCVREESLDIAVSRGTADFTSDLPIAIRVVEEAPVVDPESLPEPPDVLTPPVPEPGVARPATGAPSFADAPEIEPGTWSVALREGEQRLFRVRLGWGQSITTRVDVPALSEAELEGLSYPYPIVELAYFDPLRHDLGGLVEEAVSSVGHDEGGMLLDGTPPVAYANRFHDLPASLPGDYWVSLAVPPAPADRDAAEVPVELTLVVADDDGASAPTFPTSVRGPGVAESPEGYDAATPYLVEDGVFSADVSGTPRVPGAADDDGARRTAGLVVGGVSLLSLLAGVVLLRRRGRVSRAAAS